VDERLMVLSNITNYILLDNTDIIKNKMRCIKCGLNFKDRNDPEDSKCDKTLCWNCRFVWKVIGITIKALPTKINRDVQIRIDDIKITKIKK
jgi:hypothetical protein